MAQPTAISLATADLDISPWFKVEKDSLKLVAKAPDADMILADTAKITDQIGLNKAVVDQVKELQMLTNPAAYYAQKVHATIDAAARARRQFAADVADFTKATGDYELAKLKAAQKAKLNFDFDASMIQEQYPSIDAAFTKLARTQKSAIENATL